MEPESVRALRPSLAALEDKILLLPGDIQSAVRDIAKSAGNILECMISDPRDVDHGSRFLKRYLAATHNIADTHMRLARENVITPDIVDTLARGKDMLVRLKAAFAREHSLLLQNDITDFSAELNTLDILLQMDGNQGISAIPRQAVPHGRSCLRDLCRFAAAVRLTASGKRLQLAAKPGRGKAPRETYLRAVVS